MIFAPCINTGTSGVAPGTRECRRPSPWASSSAPSVGTAQLNTIFVAATASYTAAHAASARLIGGPARAGVALARGYDTAFWWSAAIYAGGAVAAGTLLRREPLFGQDAPGPQAAGAKEEETQAGQTTLTRGALATPHAAHRQGPATTAVAMPAGP